MATAAFKAKLKKTGQENVVPSFIKKTYDILEECKFPDIVDWNDEGTAIVILKPIEFSEKVLPTYFKHNNLTSFVRQLNMYNFHKRRTQEIDHIYYHELFQRGKKHLLKEIKRKNNEHFLSLQKTIDTLQSMQTSQDHMGTSHENIVLKKLNREALIRIDSMEKKMKDLTIQNQALWTQICGQNEREELLKCILTNLMKVSNIDPSQLPLLAQADSNINLLNNNSSQDRDILSNALLSQNLISNLQLQNQQSQMPQLPPLSHGVSVSEYMKHGESMHDPKENSQSLANLISILNNTQIDLPNKELLNDPRLMQSIPQLGNFAFPMRDSSPIHNQISNVTQPQYWNLEAEYLKALANSGPKLNGLSNFGGPMEFKGKDSVLGKRAFDFDRGLLQDEIATKLIHQDSASTATDMSSSRQRTFSGVGSLDDHANEMEGFKRRRGSPLGGSEEMLAYAMN